MRTIAITGSASGIGAATKKALESEGAKVIGIDLRNADIEADLSKPEERARCVQEIEARCDGRLDGLIPCAGISYTEGTPGSLITSINYFGSIALLDGLRSALASGESPAAIAICSNSSTITPNVPEDMIAACFEGDEKRAAALADEQPMYAYQASKTALARYVRTRAVGDEWAGAGICLNGVAPGRTRTAMDEAMLKDRKLSKAVSGLPIPVGRPGEAHEIADFIAFLMGPKARFFCGSVLFCDGGTDALIRPTAWPESLKI